MSAKREADAHAVSAGAMLRAAALLDIPDKHLVSIVGLSEPCLSRLRRGEGSSCLTGKPYELALLLVRLYRSLDTIMGGDDEASRRWLRGENTALGGSPLMRIRTIDGLSDVIAYLEARSLAGPSKRH